MLNKIKSYIKKRGSLLVTIDICLIVLAIVAKLNMFIVTILILFLLFMPESAFDEDDEKKENIDK